MAHTHHRPVTPPVELHVCPDCDAPRVLPTTWQPIGTEAWLVARRCPDCFWTGSGLHQQPELDAYDDALDRGSDALLAALDELVAERMHDDVERFLGALAYDAILPEDF